MDEQHNRTICTRIKSNQYIPIKNIDFSTMIKAYPVIYRVIWRDFVAFFVVFTVDISCQLDYSAYILEETDTGIADGFHNCTSPCLNQSD